jgi:drug/metabolite transporter (DMT)-like permease
MLVVIAPMAACYPAIKAGLEFAPSLRFAGLRTLVGGLALLLVLAIRRQPPFSRPPVRPKSGSRGLPPESNS